MDQSKLWKEKPQTLAKPESERIHTKEEDRWSNPTIARFNC